MISNVRIIIWTNINDNFKANQTQEWRFTQKIVVRDYFCLPLIMNKGVILFSNLKSFEIKEIKFL